VTRARRLRHDMTDAERAMWRLLREGFPDAYFRRQVPIRHFIADFASHRAKLIIEVDGGQHETETDASRSAIMEVEGYRVIRFWNNEVLCSPDAVWGVIESALHGRHPHPTLPHQGGGL
jgi:very-short-patch-repair endonuclease